MLVLATIYSIQDIQVTKIETKPVKSVQTKIETKPVKSVQIKSKLIRIPHHKVLYHEIQHLKLACFSLLSHILLLVFSALTFYKGHVRSPANFTNPEDNRPQFSSSFTTGIPQVSADTWTSPNANFITLLEQNSVPLTRATNNTSIEGQIYCQNLTFLINTGAYVTAARADVWRRIPELARSKPEPTPIDSMKAVSGAVVPVLGQLQIPFQVESHTYTFKALVIVPKLRSNIRSGFPGIL